MTLQCIRLAGHITLNLKNNMSRVAVFSYIEKAFDRTWHSGLLYKLSEIQFSTSVIKLIDSFLTDRKFKFSLEGEFSVPRKIMASLPQGSVLAPVLYSLYINDAPRGTWNSSCFVRERTLYLRGRETSALCSLQTATGHHYSVKSWCERCNTKTNEGEIYTICFFKRLRFLDGLLQLNGRDILFVNNVMCLDVNFDRRMTWRRHIEKNVAKALRMYVRMYSLFKIGRLNAVTCIARQRTSRRNTRTQQ
jgi:hypothetical protein